MRPAFFAVAGKMTSGRNERPFASPLRPPRTSTHSSAVWVFVTCATKTQVCRRSFTPSTTTASPVLNPAHLVERNRWPCLVTTARFFTSTF